MARERKLTDGHIQILGAAANGWLSRSHGIDDVYFISTPKIGLKSNPRPSMVGALYDDGLLRFRAGGSRDLLLTEKGRERYDADPRTVKVVAGSKLQVVAKNPPADPNVVDLSEFDVPIAQPAAPGNKGPQALRELLKLG